MKYSISDHARNEEANVPSGLERRGDLTVGEMGLRLLGQEDCSCFFVTTSFYEHRKLCNNPGVKEKLAESLKFCLEKTNSDIIGYVFMPSHIHLLILIEGKLLSNFMRDFKKFTAQQSLKHLQIDGKIWQDRFDRVAIWSIKILKVKLNYIHNNPVKAGLAELPENWRWSSAGDYYCDRKGPLPVRTDW
ncbi:MAG: transposase [Candidatus Electryonea clarkiae]|nr:transposase [Candidatus Electryonea clarkiae]MDP8287003.1 transposase [Candidatus Electryonea clarkiae]